MADTNTAKKLTGGIIAIVLLSLCLCVTTFALVYATVSVRDNLFHTGTVELDLNGGAPVITESEFRFEPGMTVCKPFYVKNNSTCDVYYRVYLDNVSGGLADVLTVTIKDGDTVLCTGTAGQLTRQRVAAADAALSPGRKQDLTIWFSYPADKGNDTQALDLTFTLCAQATQVRNNPDKRFD